MAAKVTEKFQSLSVQDSSKSEITACSWNINGNNAAGMPKARRAVVSATLATQKVFGSETTTLAQCDLICLQEVGGKTDEFIGNHVPTYKDGDYGVELSTIDPPWNMVLYRKDKFTVSDRACLDEAFELMDIKKSIYDHIKSGKDERICKAIRGDLQNPYDHEEIFKEVLEECMQAKDLVGFDDLLNRYKTAKDMVTKPPRDLLERRIAIVVLQLSKPLCNPGTAAAFKRHHHDDHLIVISFHNYSGSSGKGAPQRLAYLLFDFLEKLKMTGIRHYPVIVAGDFNCDIRTESSLEKFLSNYYIPEYQPTSLRDKLKTIDFIIASRPHQPTQQEITRAPVNPGVQQFGLSASGGSMIGLFSQTQQRYTLPSVNYPRLPLSSNPLASNYPRLPLSSNPLSSNPLASNPLEFITEPIVAAHEMVLPPHVEAVLLKRVSGKSTTGPSAPETELDRERRLTKMKCLITNHSPLSATLTI